MAELTDELVTALVALPGDPAWPAHGRVVLHAPAGDVAPWVRPEQGTVTPRDETSCVLEVGARVGRALAASGHRGPT